MIGCVAEKKPFTSRADAVLLRRIKNRCNELGIKMEAFVEAALRAALKADAAGGKQ